jgi:hypothetical protein
MEIHLFRRSFPYNTLISPLKECLGGSSDKYLEGGFLPLIRSSGTTTVFGEHNEPGPGPASFAVSLVVHGIVFAIAWFAIAYKPPFTKVVTDHYSVRKLDLQVPDMHNLPRVPSPVAHSSPHIPSPASSGSSAPSPAAPPQLAQAKIGPQTLVQPDLEKHITLTQEVPLPQVVIWSPPKVQVKTIVPPQPQKPTSAEVKPSTESPNEEVNLANVNVASSFKPSPKNIIPPSTTSPVAVHSPQPQVQMSPNTVSQLSAQPTPAAIMSLSDLRASNQTVTLPPVSEVKASNGQGPLAPGKTQNAQGTSTAKDNPNAKPGQTGTGDSAAKTASTGPGAGQGPPAKNTTPGSGPGQGNNNTASNSGPSGAGAAHPGAGSTNGLVQPVMAGATLITVPKDGHFGSVIVGAGLEDQYPEIADVWSGRLTYTAYLHVGLAKNWVLQYSLPRNTDASSAGTVAKLDAPWPYSIVRPNLDPGSIDADALMIHGFVNQSGHFETLSIVFPESFPRAQFVLAALQQWQFRPAAQDGQPARVEVLIIIPEVYE